MIIARLLSSEPWSRYPNQPSVHGREEPTQLSNQRLAGSLLFPRPRTQPARCRRYHGTFPSRSGTIFNPSPSAHKALKLLTASLPKNRYAENVFGWNDRRSIYFLKRSSKAWRASRGRETCSAEADGPATGADGAVSFSIVVRNS